MSLMSKIQKVLDEKLEDKQKNIDEKKEFKATVVEVSESGAYIVEDSEGVKFKVQINEGELEVGADVEVIADMTPKRVLEAKDKDMDDDDPDDEDMKDDKKEKKEKKEKVDVKEALAKIFKDAKIDEALSGDLETLFNVVVDEKVTEIVSEHIATLDVKSDQEIGTAVAEMTESVDKYLSYTAKEWLKENELNVEQGIVVEISENLIGSLKTIFEDSYVTVPESKVDLVKEAEETIDSLLTTVDEEKERADTLQLKVNSMKSKNIVDEVATDLTDVQKEKLGTLTEGIDYTNDAEYTQKIKVVVENYFTGKKDAGEQNLDESDKSGRQKNDRMSAFVKHLRKE